MLSAKCVFRFFAVFLLIFLFIPNSPAAKYALIISCRAGNAQLHSENKVCAAELLKLLKNKGFKNIDVFFEGGDAELKGSVDINRPAITAKLKQLGGQLDDKDQLWLFLLGHASASPRRVSMASKNGRLSGKKLAALLDTVKAEQFIFCLNTQSHGLMGLLAKPKRLVLCATNSYGQLNPPRFTAFFIKVWAESGKSDLFDIAKKAGRLTEDFYKSNNLAVAENSQIYYKGEILPYPFDGSKNDWLNFAMPEASPDDVPGSKPVFTPELEGIKIHPPTSETRAKLAEARKLAAVYPQYAAVYIGRDIDLTLKPENSSQLSGDEAIYLNRDSASEVFGVFRVPVPVGSTSKITQAKIIYPDGSYADFNVDSKDFSHLVIFSGLRQGCLLLRSSLINVPAPGQLPDYNNDLKLQTRFPVVATRVKLTVPKKSLLRYKLYNSSVIPEISSSQYSKNYLFKINSIPSYSYLPGDPDYRKICMHLALSTMKSWKDFTAWTNRMFHRAGKVDPASEKFLKKLIKGCKTDTEKVKRIYNFLCGLRYLTVPVGAGAFRPRLPGLVIRERYGDCKDKANALVALAGKLGIKAYRVLVNRGAWTDKTFPSWQFNHMIAYFPKLSDYPQGIWLDATDGATRFGTLPPGDIGRTGMLIKDKLFEFKTINLSGNIKNIIKRNIELAPGKDPEKLTGTISISASGLPDYRLRQRIKRLSPRQLKFFIHKRIDSFLPGFSVKNFKIVTKLTDISTPLNITVEVEGEFWMLNTAQNALADSVWSQLSFPQREYGVTLNDGQSLRLLQTLTLKGKPRQKHLREWRKENEYLSIDFSTRQTAEFIQKFELNLKKTEIPLRDYSQVRDLILKFKNKINGGQ